MNVRDLMYSLDDKVGQLSTHKSAPVVVEINGEEFVIDSVEAKNWPASQGGPRLVLKTGGVLP